MASLPMHPSLTVLRIFSNAAKVGKPFIFPCLPRRRSRSLEYLFDQTWNLENGLSHRNVCRLQSCNFTLRGTGIAGDDRACVSHAFSGRSGTSGDECNDGLAHGFDIFGGILFVATTDLAAHYDGFCFGVLLEKFQVVGKR